MSELLLTGVCLPQSCVRCASYADPVECYMVQGETHCEKCLQDTQGCYWLVSPGATPINYSGGHRQRRNAAASQSNRDGSTAAPVTPSSRTGQLLVSHNKPQRAVFRTRAPIRYVEETPSMVAALRRRVAYSHDHDAATPTIRALADMAEEALAHSQVQLGHSVQLLRALVFEGAPGFVTPAVPGEEFDDADASDGYPSKTEIFDPEPLILEDPTEPSPFSRVRAVGTEGAEEDAGPSSRASTPPVEGLAGTGERRTPAGSARGASEVAALSGSADGVGEVGEDGVDEAEGAGEPSKDAEEASQS